MVVLKGSKFALQSFLISTYLDCVLQRALAYVDQGLRIVTDHHSSLSNTDLLVLKGRCLVLLHNYQ